MNIDQDKEFWINRFILNSPPKILDFQAIYRIRISLVKINIADSQAW